MYTVNNIPRIEAINWETPLNSSEYAWVSIQEPGTKHINNPILDRLPNLKISFWDIVKPIQLYNSEEWVYPPTEEHAKQIVDFLLEHDDKNVLINCKAGVSRSSAVSRFCHEYLGYIWQKDGYDRAVPNQLLYDMMAKYYDQPKKTKIIDKRRLSDFGNRTMIVKQ